jgi:hypothetical protein
VFPDATFIITHRDPIDVAVSMATMMTYTMRMSVDKVDVPTVANYWITRIDEMLSACMRDHPASGRSHAELRRRFAPDVERFVTS